MYAGLMCELGVHVSYENVINLVKSWLICERMGERIRRNVS